MTRTLVTIPAKWPFPSEQHWVYRSSDYEWVSSKLPKLTPKELELVWLAVAELLGKSIEAEARQQQ